MIQYEGLFPKPAPEPHYNKWTFKKLYKIVKGMRPWERTKLIDEFLHDASYTAFHLELDFRRFVESCTEHM